MRSYVRSRKMIEANRVCGEFHCDEADGKLGIFGGTRAEPIMGGCHDYAAESILVTI